MLRRAQAARLLAVDREAPGTRLLLLGRDEAAVGSAEGSGLRVADASVADRHATIGYARGGYYVADLKSAGGTFLNGRRIRRKHELKHGDIIRFGGAAPYRFIDPDALKRRRWRRSLRAGAVVAALVAIGLADHFEKWGLFSLATATEIVAWAESHAASKRVDAPMAGVAIAPTTTASSARPTNTPAAAFAVTVAVMAPSPTPNLPASSPATWLERINFYRWGAGLGPIRENPQVSAGAAAHARYLLLNFGEDIRSAKPMSAEAYEERPGKSGYSANGATAARSLQLAWGCSSDDAGQQIDHWIEGPFHRFAMLDPFLTEAGFGEASSDGCWVDTLRLPPPPEEAKPYALAIEFPPDGAAVSLEWIGLEAPDPLASCPGYDRPVGLPITLQIGRLVDAKLSAHSLMEDGKPNRALCIRRAKLSKSERGRAGIRPLESARLECGGDDPASAASTRLALLGLDYREPQDLCMELHDRGDGDNVHCYRPVSDVGADRAARDRANEDGIAASTSKRATVASREPGADGIGDGAGESRSHGAGVIADDGRGARHRRHKLELADRPERIPHAAQGAAGRGGSGAQPRMSRSREVSHDELSTDDGQGPAARCSVPS